MTLISLLVVLGALVLFAVLGACGAFALDLWDRVAERRAERRLRRDQLHQIIRH